MAPLTVLGRISSTVICILPHDTPQTRLSVPILVFYNVTGFGTPSSDRARHVQHSTCFATVPRIHFGVILQQRRTTCRKTRAPAVYSVVRHRRSQVISRAGLTPPTAPIPQHISHAIAVWLARQPTDAPPPHYCPRSKSTVPVVRPRHTMERRQRDLHRRRLAIAAAAWPPPARHDARRCQYAARACAGRVRT